jgi:hypothetical protein
MMQTSKKNSKLENDHMIAITLAFFSKSYGVGQFYCNSHPDHVQNGHMIAITLLFFPPSLSQPLTFLQHSQLSFSTSGESLILSTLHPHFFLHSHIIFSVPSLFLPACASFFPHFNMLHHDDLATTQPSLASSLWQLGSLDPLASSLWSLGLLPPFSGKFSHACIVFPALKFFEPTHHSGILAPLGTSGGHFIGN